MPKYKGADFGRIDWRTFVKLRSTPLNPEEDNTWVQAVARTVVGVGASFNAYAKIVAAGRNDPEFRAAFTALSLVVSPAQFTTQAVHELTQDLGGEILVPSTREIRSRERKLAMQCFLDLYQTWEAKNGEADVKQHFWENEPRK